MQKTFILGVLFACTTITYSSNFDRNDTPPIAKLTSDNFDQSIKHSDDGNSPDNHFQDTPPHQNNFNSSFSLRPDSLRPSITPIHSANCSPNHFQVNNSISENDNNSFLVSEVDARPSTPVQTDEELLRLYQEFINSCLIKFNANLEKAKIWESEQRLKKENAKIADIIVDAMRNPDHSDVVSSQTKSAFSKIKNDYPFTSKQPFSANGQYPSKTRE